MTEPPPVGTHTRIGLTGQERTCRLCSGRISHRHAAAKMDVKVDDMHGRLGHFDWGRSDIVLDFDIRISDSAPSTARREPRKAPQSGSAARQPPCNKVCRSATLSAYSGLPARFVNSPGSFRWSYNSAFSGFPHSV